VTVAPVLLWFRWDLRLQDNPALLSAMESGGAVIPVFILDEAGEGRWPPGAASRWWLYHSLAALDTSLRALGSRLILTQGDSLAVLRELQRLTGARSIFWNRRYEPASIVRDQAIKEFFNAAGVEAKSCNSALLFEPHTIANKQGKPFQVFTPFWRHCLSLPVAAPVKFHAQRLPAPARWPASLAPADLDLLPRIPWTGGLAGAWVPGEAGGRRRLQAFIAAPVDAYAEGRNLPASDGTSLLSPWLHFGELGPRQIWAALQLRAKASGIFPSSNGERVFLSELGWREFAHHLLFHFPYTPGKPLREDFGRFPWAKDPGGKLLRAWQRGRTGYPIVDAGMRQLWHTGWMHNRVRMIAASFLVKHLRLPWTQGAAWFWDTLVDADLANNTLGWQWTAGCGADAAPYFRIFAPVLQGEKFDAEGNYVRRWVPELAQLPAKWIHRPWEAPAEVLAAAGVCLGDQYPRPIVDHAVARAAALAAFKEMRSAGLIRRG
jgi:deoxyribodipyrimidine photo-lyase